MDQEKVVRRETAVALGVATTILFVALVAVSVVYLQINYDLKSTLNLEKQEFVVKEYSVTQGAGSYSKVAFHSYPYSGYLLVSGTSTTSNAWVNLQYWFEGKLYSFTQTIGTSGELFFAIPKTDSATVYAGNNNSVDEANETLTIVYHY